VCPLFRGKGKEWATVVRWVGNDAAHPNKDAVSKEDAEDCLRLAEQFLHVIFVSKGGQVFTFDIADCQSKVRSRFKT